MRKTLIATQLKTLKFGMDSQILKYVILLYILIFNSVRENFGLELSMTADMMVITI